MLSPKATELMAGLFSGVPEALVTTPFQVVKIRMQRGDLGTSRRK